MVPFSAKSHQPPKHVQILAPLADCRILRRFTICTQNLGVLGGHQRSKELKEYHQLNNVKILAPLANCMFLINLPNCIQNWASFEVRGGQERSKKLKEYHQLSNIQFLTVSASKISCEP